jgi:hypothetical protein
VYGSETAESYLEKLGGSPVLLYTMETVSDPISACYGSSYAPTKIEYTGEDGQYRYTVSLSGNLVKDGAESAVEMTAIGRVQFKDGKIIMISLDSGTISDYFS